MFKRLVLFLILLFSFHLAHANVVINEAQLSPTDGRFIELYNNADSAVDLTGYYMQRKTASGSTFGSLVSNPNFEGKSIDAHGYFVISRSPINNSNIVVDNLTLTESNTIQIKNSAGDVIDKVGWGTASDCGSPCPANPAEGQSIQKTSSGWVTATPTLGGENETTASTSENSSNTSTSNSTNSSSNSNTTITEIKPKVTEEPKIKVQIIAKSVAMIGLPVTFEGVAYGLSGEKLNYGKYFWNFGDGDSKEIKTTGMGDTQKFTHTYFYSGAYDVSLEYYSNLYAITPDATNRMSIKAVPADISISSVGNESDFFVELSNNTSYDADISNWILTSDAKNFTIPRNTILKAKGKMILSPRITNFSISDKDTLKLFSSDGKIVFEYEALVAKAVAVKIKNNNIIKPEVSVEQTINPANTLQASVVSSNVTQDNPLRTYLLTTLLTVFVGGSAGAVYFIRQKRAVGGVGDDFKILDE